MGIVYILHLETPLSHARHYCGWSTNTRTLKERLSHHERGTAGCNFTKVLHEKGIAFKLATTFKDVDRHFERKLKNTHSVDRYCPICNPKATKVYKPKCKHPNKVGDNYGISCSDCKKALKGYGWGGWFGSNLKHGRKCIHDWMWNGDGSEHCQYCQMERVVNVNSTPA